MNQTEPNAMEELAKASMTIADLAQGRAGTAYLYAGEDGSNQDVVAQIHAGQVFLYLAGWRQDREKERLLNGGHVHEGCVYRKRFPGERATRYISGWVSRRFGVVACFTSTQEQGDFVTDRPDDPFLCG